MFDGTVQPRVISPVEVEVTVTAVGAFEVVFGVTAVVEGAPSPLAVTGVTRSRYVVPLVSAVSVALVVATVLGFVQLAPPSVLRSTRYPVTGRAPLFAGAVQDTLAAAFDAVALSALTAPGSVSGVTLASALYAPMPRAFTAATCTVYVVPFTKPLMLPLVFGDPVSLVACVQFCAPVAL